MLKTYFKRLKTHFNINRYPVYFNSIKPDMYCHAEDTYGVVTSAGLFSMNRCIMLAIVTVSYTS